MKKEKKSRKTGYAFLIKAEAEVYSNYNKKQTFLSEKVEDYYTKIFFDAGVNCPIKGTKIC